MILRSITSIILVILLVFGSSCKLFETADTTDPVVNLTIAGGNEISREVTLYLDIEDDSKIDRVSIIIDDSTYATVYSNFDTIKFIVNRFEDFIVNDSAALLEKPRGINEFDYEHQLFLRAYDSEGNIGESKTLDVVITEYPGWRVYDTFDYNVTFLQIDNNDLIWIGCRDGVRIYDIINNTWRTLNTINSELPENYINEIKIVQGSRVWICTDSNISEYDYYTNRWIKIIEIPLDPIRNFNPLGWTIDIDKNYNVWIGTRDGTMDHKLIEYIHSGFVYHSVPLERLEIDNIKFHPDGTLYIACDGGIFALRDGEVQYTGNRANSDYLAIDSIGNVWSEGYYLDGGLMKYNGSNWENVRLPTFNQISPLIASSRGKIYCEVRPHSGIDVNGYNTFTSRGLATYDGIIWTFFDEYDSPFNKGVLGGSDHWYFYHSIGEASNGDIWMVAGSKLRRYRPPLGVFE